MEEGGKTEKSRETRRRRIVDRGTDRLAFITGQISSIPATPSPPPPPPPPTPKTYEAMRPSSPRPPRPPPSIPTIPIVETITPPPAPSRPSIPHRLEEQEGPKLRSRRGDMLGEQDNDEAGSGSILNHVEKLEDISSTLDSDDNVQPLVPPVHYPRGPTATIHPTTAIHLPNVFTAKQIVSSISATENIRATCAVVAALLVIIASSHETSLIAAIVRWFIPFPLYMFLLTDITIVLGHAFSNGSQSGVHEGRRNVGADEYGFSGQLEKALDVGWVTYNAISGLFMDSSIYAVLMVCGLSLVQ
ncbi:hypothetical protein EJ110_NYTH21162 [Nymphaea thermarum]|nr:hypothetical protein EJ110_NYTH21162 [Nymphaea thermarum]